MRTNKAFGKQKLLYSQEAQLYSSKFSYLVRRTRATSHSLELLSCVTQSLRTLSKSEIRYGTVYCTTKSSGTGSRRLKRKMYDIT